MIGTLLLGLFVAAFGTVLWCLERKHQPLFKMDACPWTGQPQPRFISAPRALIDGYSFTNTLAVAADREYIYFKRSVLPLGLLSRIRRVRRTQINHRGSGYNKKWFAEVGGSKFSLRLGAEIEKLLS